MHCGNGLNLYFNTVKQEKMIFMFICDELSYFLSCLFGVEGKQQDTEHLYGLFANRFAAHEITCSYLMTYLYISKTVQLTVQCLNFCFSLKSDNTKRGKSWPDYVFQPKVVEVAQAPRAKIKEM